MADKTRLKEFLKFYELNPDVYRVFKNYAFEAWEAGATGLGGRNIWERMRWNLIVEVNGTTKPKLCNNHVPYFTRLLMARYPIVFAPLFSVRAVTFDSTPAEVLRECDRIDREKLQKEMEIL